MFLAIPTKHPTISDIGQPGESESMDRRRKGAETIMPPPAGETPNVFPLHILSFYLNTFPYTIFRSLRSLFLSSFASFTLLCKRSFASSR